MKNRFLLLSVLLLSACAQQSNDQSDENMQNDQTQPQNSRMKQRTIQQTQGCDGSCCPHKCTRPTTTYHK